MKRDGISHIPCLDFYHYVYYVYLHFRDTVGQSEWCLGLTFEFSSCLRVHRWGNGVQSGDIQICVKKKSLFIQWNKQLQTINNKWSSEVLSDWLIFAQNDVSGERDEIDLKYLSVQIFSQEFLVSSFLIWWRIYLIGKFAKNRLDMLSF